jgi:hypothetical protein
MTKTDLEIKKEFNSQIQSVSAVIKKYIDEQDVITRDGLADEVINRLSGDKGLAGQLNRVQEIANAFVSVFDGDEDGKITKEEILLKLAANNETVQDLVNRIVLAEAAIRNLKTATANNTTAIQGNTQSISNLSLAVEQVKNDYLTKDGAFAIFADTVSVVEGVFYPSSDDSSDDNAL